MLRVTFDHNLDEIIRKLASPDFSRVGQGMDMAGGLVANTWESAAYGARLPGMTRSLNWPAYARTVEHHLQGEFSLSVAANDQMTETATSSRPARDMKPGLLSGPHAQMGAHGRYNVIPMRHRAEDLSSDAVMALVQNLRNFRSLTGLRSKLTPVGPYTWTTGHESGIRMGRSGPVTFRTVSDRSPAASWWYPALPENPILDAVWAMVREDVGDMVFRSWVEALGMEEGGGAI